MQKISCLILSLLTIVGGMFALPASDARAGELYNSSSFLRDFNYGDYDLRNRRLPSVYQRRYANFSTAAARGAFNVFRPLPGTGVNEFEERRFAYARWKYNYEVRAYEWYARELERAQREHQRQEYRDNLEAQRRDRMQFAMARRANLDSREPGSRARLADNFFSRWTGGNSSSTAKSASKAEKAREQKPSFWSKLKYSIFGSKSK